MMELRSIYIVILSLRKNKPEYPFWLMFFGMVNESWKKEFQARTAGNGKEHEFIKWDFMDGVDANASKATQYRQALGVTTGIINTSSSLTKTHFNRLLDGAEQVLAGRRREQSRHSPGNSKWDAHEQIIKLWAALVEAIQSRLAT